MRTSAAGNRKDWAPACARTARSALGFTLVELLVVIAIIALASAGVSFALRDTGQTQLEREAQRLAALLESARAQSRASGVPVRWTAVPGGFHFDGVPAGTLPDQWLSPSTQVEGNTTLLLVQGSEKILGG